LFERTEYGGIIAKVVLPISVDAAVRTAQSNSVWQTERMAKNDAAFQAYKSLHLAGLVNDNLLPHRQEQDIEAAEFQIPDHTPSMVEVSQPFDPWIEVAKQQEQAPRTYYRYLLETSTVGKEPIHMVLYVASSMPTVPDIPLYWNESTIFSVKSTQLPSITLSEQELDYLRFITRQLLLSAFSSKMSVERHDFLWLLVPSELYDPSQNPQGLQQWIENTQGYTPAIELIGQNKLQVSKWGLVIARGDNRKFILQDIELQSTKMTVAGIPIPQLQVIRTPKRRDFLHRPVEGKQEKVNEMYSRTEWLDVDDCIVENLPAIYSIFALFAPSILHKYEICMVADTLRNTILKPVMFEESHLGLLLRAITSSATGESDNYQRLEFLGDCILKFISSVHLMAAHPTWPESYLTGKKGKVVSNGFLARATMSAGLDKFIVTKRFTGLKWAPRYANDVLEYGKSTGSHEPNEPKQPLKPQEKSSKLLADVIESLLGASYIVGGFPKAFTCVQTLLPLESWTSISEANIILYEAAPDDFMPTNLDGLENLIGYPFSKKLLLVQALTHASYNGPNAGYPYERLEFLGDAVLDYIVSTRLYNHSPELSHQTMHSIRTSMVNASFLAFRMFETKLQVTNTNKKTFEEEKVDRVLWQFLRHGEPKLIGARDAALKQHNECRDILLEELQTDGRFPWHLLSLMDAPKFLSDIVESVIGAIYVDSQGSIEACEVFVRRLGILDCLERILTDRVDCLHPKERLGHLAVEKDVRYVKVAPTKDENPATEGSYTVQVKMGGENIGGPVEGLRRLNAETMAAWKACRIIEGLDDVGMRDVDEEASDEEWHDAEEGGGILLEGV
jgi:dsRNA-specific ribonuclease